MNGMQNNYDPEEILVDSDGDVLFYDPVEPCGWEVDESHSMIDTTPDLIWRQNGSQGWEIAEGREERVRKWVVKGRLMNPNFHFNLDEENGSIGRGL